MLHTRGGAPLPGPAGLTALVPRRAGPGRAAQLTRRPPALLLQSYRGHSVEQPRGVLGIADDDWIDTVAAELAARWNGMR